MKKLIVFSIAFTVAMAFCMSSKATAKITDNNNPKIAKIFVKSADTLDKYRNDPDWQIMAKIQYQFINSFVANKKIRLDNFDFNNEAALLNVIGMTKEEYLAQVQLNKEAAQRFIAKYNNSGKCSSCNLTYAEQVNTLKTVLKSFQANPVQYSNFVNGSLSAGGGQNLAQNSCCGFWFYACCAVCALSIEAFPVYLACCALCYHSECCSN